MRRRDLGLAFVWSMCFWVFFKGLIERTAVQYCFILLQCSFQECVCVCVCVCVCACMCWVSFRVNHRYVCLSSASLVSGRTLSQASWRAYGCVCKCIRKMNVFTANRCIFHLCVCVSGACATWHWLVFLGRWAGPALTEVSAAIGVFPHHFVGYLYPVAAWDLLHACPNLALAGSCETQHGPS